MHPNGEIIYTVTTILSTYRMNSALLGLFGRVYCGIMSTFLGCEWWLPFGAMELPLFDIMLNINDWSIATNGLPSPLSPASCNFRKFELVPTRGCEAIKRHVSHWQCASFRTYDIHHTDRFYIMREQSCKISSLTYWDRDQTAAISQTTFSNTFSCIKMCGFRVGFHLNLLLSFEWTISWHWCR